ncbi:Ltp family lipoprotein [Oerskovia sp. M15]
MAAQYNSPRTGPRPGRWTPPPDWIPDPSWGPARRLAVLGWGSCRRPCGHSRTRIRPPGRQRVTSRFGYRQADVEILVRSPQDPQRSRGARAAPCRHCSFERWQRQGSGRSVADATATQNAQVDEKTAEDAEAAETAEEDRLAEEQRLSDETAAAEAAAAEAAAAEAAAAEAARIGTVAQQNAFRSAVSYLEYTAFSRTGLAGQLEFEDFSPADAEFAIARLEAEGGVDWNVQAAASAAGYLDYTSFSRSGLVDQLIYEGFTAEQAEYGVSTTGL